MNTTYVNVTGYEVEKIRRPYGSAPKNNRKNNKKQRIDRKTIRGN